MPIYEYRRPDGTTFEVQQAFSDEPLEHDPDTGVPVTRVLHAPAVHFKGKGFYNTDYGTRNRQRETAAAAAAEKSQGGEKSSDAGKGEGGRSEGGKADGGKSEGGKGDGGKSDSGKVEAAKPSSSNGGTPAKKADKPLAAKR
jgi:predicted nucleic acid-binding Zn ribbon protein